MLIANWLEYFIAIAIILTAWTIVYKLLEKKE